MDNCKLAVKCPLQPLESGWVFLVIGTSLMGFSFTTLAADTTKLPAESLDAIYQRVFGKEKNLPTELVADLRIMGRSLGEATAQTDGNQIVSLPSALLQTNLEAYLKADLYAQVQSLLHQQSQITLQQLEFVGINAEYNTLDLVIELKIRPSSLNRRMRSVLSALAGQGAMIPERLAEPAKMSGYVNFFSDWSYQTREGGNEIKTQARLDSAINVHGFVFEQQYTYQPDTPSKLTRNHSRLVIDRVENESRYQLGDIQIRGRNLQSSMNLGGIQWLHDMNWPTAQIYRPHGNYRFTLDSAAEVQVYQDGKLTNTVRLNAGEHRLDSIQATQGFEIELRIKNDFGQISTQRFSRFTDSRLLHPEASRYAISIGFPSEYKDKELHYDTQHKIVSGYYQRGISETLTAGIDVQTNGSHHQVGTDAIWATSLGTISASITQTRKQQKKGHALRMQINPPARPVTTEQSPSLNWSAAFERYSRDFQPFSLSTDDLAYSTQWLASAQLSRNFANHLNIGVSATQAADFSGQSRRSLQASVSKQLNKRLALSLSAQQQQETTGKTDHSFQFNLNFTLDKTANGRSQGLNAAYNDFNEGAQLNYYLGGKGAYGLDSLSSSAQLETSQNQHNLSLSTRWQQPTWDGSATLQHNDRRSQATDTHLNLNTALVFADGAVARSKPVSDSFAILEAPLGLQQPMAASQGKSLFARSEQDPQGLPERYDVLIPPEGKAALSSLGSYNVQHVSTDSHVLPENLDLNATEFDVLPDYKSGYRLKVGGERGVNLQVKVLNAQGQLIAFQAAHLVATKQKKLIQTVFTDADGVIHIPNLGSGSYRLEWLNRPASQSTGIEVTASAGQTQTLELRLP